MNDSQSKAFHTVVQTWSGGEHVLAGARASELIYGAGNKPNQKILDDLIEAIPGVERYISAPQSGVVTTQVGEQSGDPLATQPENRDQNLAGRNQSSDAAKSEQNSVDAALKAGRDARAKSGEENPLGSTELNPGNDLSNSSRDPLDHDGNGRKGGVKK